LVGSPDGADKTWVTEQYDHYVRGNTVLASPHDAGVLRIDEKTFIGVAIATDGNGRFCLLDPYAGAQLALAEAYRNVAATGAVPLAVTNCLNFGSPEDPAVMWQFAESVRGLADACQAMGVPVTGGNVSFYNQTGAQAIHPTPIVGVLGVLADVRRRLPAAFTEPGETIILLGSTAAEFGGSMWAHVLHGHVGGVPPAVDLDAEQRLAALLADGAARGLFSAAHDLSDGGLAVALAECCLTGGDAGLGAVVQLPADLDPFVSLFSESVARVIVAVKGAGDVKGAGEVGGGPQAQEEASQQVSQLCAEHGVPAQVVGRTGGDALEVAGHFTIGLTELRRAHQDALPGIFG
jgi:phosphoribosylformylglycinamidine synthase